MVLAILMGAFASIFNPPEWEEHRFPDAVIYVGSGNDVRRICLKMGAEEPTTFHSLKGCADLGSRIGYAIDDPAVIDHERCHIEKQTYSHDICPLPFLRRR